MKLRIVVLELLVILIWFLAGCNSMATRLPDTSTPKVDISGMALPTALLTSTDFPSPIPTRAMLPTDTPIATSTNPPISIVTNTPVPTLTLIKSENYIQELLGNNGSCSLPCVWGITPGKTSSTEAKKLFNYLGWKGSVSHGVYYTGRDLKTSSIVIGTSIYPPEDGKLVEKVHVGIGGNDYLRFVKYLSFTNILSTLGKPTQILVFVGTTPSFIEPFETLFQLLLYYDLQNVLIEYTGTAIKIDDRYQICPTHPNAKSSVMNPLSGNMDIYASGQGTKSTPDELVRPFWELPTYFISSETALDVNQDQFYKIATQTSESNCFYSRINVWRR